MLGLLQHFLLRGLIDFQLSRHPADQYIERLIHFFNTLKLALLELLHGVLRKQETLPIVMQVILLGNVLLDDLAVGLMEIGQHFK